MTSFTHRVAATWNALAGVSDGFRPGAITVLTVEGSQICPPGWNGAVRLGDATLITTPTEETADRVRTLVAGVRPEQACDPRIYPAAEVLGPATLAYLDPTDFAPAKSDGVETAGPLDPTFIETGETGDVGSTIEFAIATLESACDRADVDEAGISEVTSPLFVTPGTTAACGYRIWRGSFAHMCVLVHPEHRGHGLARAVASMATAHALEAGLIPQWRARPAESRAVARALGYSYVGDQLSFRL